MRTYEIRENDERGRLYLMYDRAGDLLYVGQTLRWQTRMQEHAKHWWWPQVHTIYVLPAPNRDERMRIERALTQTLSPRHNICHTGRHAEGVLRRNGETYRSMYRTIEASNDIRRRINMAAWKAGLRPNIISL